MKLTINHNHKEQAMKRKPQTLSAAIFALTKTVGAIESKAHKNTPAIQRATADYLEIEGRYIKRMLSDAMARLNQAAFGK